VRGADEDDAGVVLVVLVSLPLGEVVELWPPSCLVGRSWCWLSGRDALVFESDYRRRENPCRLLALCKGGECGIRERC
jgi:hypothetical protein